MTEILSEKCSKTVYLFSGISSHYFPVLHDWVAEMQNETVCSKICKMRGGREEENKPKRSLRKQLLLCLDTTGALISGEEHVNVAGFTLSV